MVEHRVHIAGVTGSSPVQTTTIEPLIGSFFFELLWLSEKSEFDRIRYMSTALKLLEKKLEAYDVQKEVLLSELTSFHIGGPATLVMHAHRSDELKDAVRTCNELDVPWHLLGKGSDILAPDSGFSGLIICMDHPADDPVIVDGRMRCSAGSSLTSLARYSIACGFSGMEHLAGIPGTLGGAVAMNAGAFGTEIRDLLRQVTFLEKGIVQTFDVNEEDLGYRFSKYHAPERIVLEAELELYPDLGDAKTEMEECLARRIKKQPLEYPSAGSVFKRPKGNYAGALIEQCGLKGERIGDAQVSLKHAGFIVNLGKATERDVLALIDRVQGRVFQETGYLLEREIKLLSEA